MKIKVVVTNSLNRVVYVDANFQPIGTPQMTDVPTGETKSTLTGGEKEVTKRTMKWQKTGWSPSRIDGQQP